MCDFFSLDDIQDNSVLRRGIPVAHSIYGVASTINAANYVIFLALEKVLKLNHPEVSIQFSYETFSVWVFWYCVERLACCCIIISCFTFCFYLNK